jgi:hypothetical protein
MRCSRVSICVLVRSRIARWASRSMRFVSVQGMCDKYHVVRYIYERLWHERRVTGGERASLRKNLGCKLQGIGCSNYELG